jgi:uncharacterized membrane protein YgcG
MRSPIRKHSIALGKSKGDITAVVPLAVLWPSPALYAVDRAAVPGPDRARLRGLLVLVLVLVLVLLLLLLLVVMLLVATLKRPRHCSPGLRVSQYVPHSSVQLLCRNCKMDEASSFTCSFVNMPRGSKPGGGASPGGRVAGGGGGGGGGDGVASPGGGVGVVDSNPGGGSADLSLPKLFVRAF